MLIWFKRFSFSIILQGYFYFIQQILVNIFITYFKIVFCITQLAG